MKLRMLVTPEIQSIPDDIKTIVNWGDTWIMSDNEEFHGDHAYLEGTKESFIKWLGSYDGFWVGKDSSPMLEEFEVVHIKDKFLTEGDLHV